MKKKRLTKKQKAKKELMVLNMKQHKTKPADFHRRVLKFCVPVWRKYQEHGDMVKLCKLLGVSRTIIARAFCCGTGSMRTIETINFFYRAKMKDSMHDVIEYVHATTEDINDVLNKF